MIRETLSIFKNIFENRKLLVQFSFNDFKSKYAGSALGIVWAFITPLVTVLTYWFVFSHIRARGADEAYPFIVYLVTGLIPWFFFSDSLLSATNVFREYSYLVKKVVFNVQILPTSKILSSLYAHVVFIFIGFGITSLSGVFPTVKALQLLYYLFCLIIFLTAVTWLTASTQPFLPDIMQFINVAMQTIMWTLPVIWIPSENIARFLKINPLYYVIQGYRDSFTNGPWFWENWQYGLYFWGFTIILLLIGSGVFGRLKPHFSDVL
ncbi:ABC transporter permease [Enterococcus termitis]|jgi:teichoic acid transport system permease protein|uniref:Teichoic acid ABC transporter permease n=1 Tax=Enterococcus termitis TaxID=332950 RepID=A0A1E5H5V7_9ENTE|nr:ABC transporter permease [Enterococcus termitis]OEG20358.1 teichoic acid ABC transporter permease [Enterococcus termitis]OJH00107.1 ABC transporter permease [Enterococcus termitis]